MKDKDILIVDDSQVIRSTIEMVLKNAGFKNLHYADSARAALELLGINPPRDNLDDLQPYDLVLLDIVLPDVDGRIACRLIKSAEHLVDVPVIMVTSLTTSEDLKKAFDAGAMDYITKPVNDVELLARIQSALKLKMAVDERKKREAELLQVTKQLEEAVQELNRLSTLDGLTGIANRRFFDQSMEREWNRAKRNDQVLSLIFIDIDCFKFYNDHYGHLAGDDCLKKVATLLNQCIKRGGDMLFRYGGEEFLALLADTPAEKAKSVAEDMRLAVERAELEHSSSTVMGYVTISLGVSEATPADNSLPDQFIAAADEALYRAKEKGRNRVEMGTR